MKELVQVTLMIYNKDNIIQTFMDPTPKLPPKPFINKYSKKYYNVCQQGFNLSISNNGEVTCLNRKKLKRVSLFIYLASFNSVHFFDIILQNPKNYQNILNLTIRWIKSALYRRVAFCFLLICYLPPCSLD